MSLASSEHPADDAVVYEITAEDTRAPWVSRSLRQLLEHHRRVPVSRWGVSTVGLLVTVAIHMSLIGSVILGGARVAHSGPHERPGPGARAVSSGDEPAMTLIFIQDLSKTRKAEDEEPASHGLAPSDLTVRVVSLDDTPAFEFPDDSRLSVRDDTEERDPEARARLLGRYTGQIKARIERAWLRPRSPIGSSSFECSARIEQDAAGSVEDVTLLNCNGSADWDQSLIQAIRSASPLPAPPDPSVFASAVTIAFNSEAYAPGQIPDGFQTYRAASRDASYEAAPSAKSLVVNASPSALRDRHATDIKLTIEGNRVVVAPALAVGSDNSPSPVRQGK